MKVLHLSSCEKFLPDFVAFINSYFRIDMHYFYLTKGSAQDRLKDFPNVRIEKKGRIKRVVHYCLTLFKMHQSNKVILHGLFDNNILAMLLVMPWLCKKTYWVIWGEDSISLSSFRPVNQMEHS